VRHGSTADTAQAAAFVTFDELCARQANGHAHAASDFWALACAFPVVCLAQVPQLRPRQQRDEARRLVVLIDALYEARCRLFVAAAVPPSHVFAKLLEADTAARSARGEVCGGGGSGRPASSDEQRESLLTAEEKLMFRRAVSRLGELCGDIRSTA
jgi:predicted ATPase